MRIYYNKNTRQYIDIKRSKNFFLFPTVFRRGHRPMFQLKWFKLKLIIANI